MTAVNDIFLITLRYTLYQQRMINTFHYRISAQTAPVAEAAAADGIIEELNEAGSLVDEMRVALPPQLSLDAIWAQKISPTRFRAKKTVLGVDGTWGGDSTTTNVAAAVTRHDAFATRRSQGRIEVPISADDTAVQAGVLQGTMLDALEDICDQMILERISNSGAITWKPVIYHRGFAPGQDFTDVVGANPELTARVLTRRTVGRGE